MPEPIELMLPPKPGTDEPHPGVWFWMDGDYSAFDTDYPYQNPRLISVVRGDGSRRWNIIAAAAIAHYWNEHWRKFTVETPCDFDESNFRWDMTIRWSAIASGSRKYDNAKIVAYKPRGSKS